MNKILVTILVAVLFTVSGCGYSQPSRFYRLSPVSYKDMKISDAPSAINTLSVGPVTIPVALSRPQIVSLSGDNEVFISEYDRWAGSLSDIFARTLADNLSVLLPSQTVVPYELGRRLDSSYQLVVDIQQFDGRMGKDVTLKAGWLILDKGSKKPLVVNRSMVTEKVPGNDYDSFVAAMSAALGRLSFEIAQAFSGL